MSQRHPVQNGMAMLVTTNVAKREPIFMNDAYAREAVDAIYRTQLLYPFFLYAFVIMPDHAHLLLHVPSPGSISLVIQSYKRAVSFGINKGSLWQPRFHIRMPDNVMAARRYIHMNPVQAGLVETPEKYLWSSASGRWDVQDVDYWQSF